jgi:hypothetical protein
MYSIDQSLSLYIPRVTRRMTDLFIAETIENMGLGCVGKVDLVETADGRQMTAYVHFADWSDTSENRQLQQRIKDPKQQARLVYDAPWYWILLVNNNPEPATDKMDVEVVVPEPVSAPVSVARIPSNPVSAQNTFAAVLRGTTIRPPAITLRNAPPLTPRDPPVPAQDIQYMTQMAMDCDEEWNAVEQETARDQMARDQGTDTDESYTQRLNEELKVIIGDLQSRLAWCEQMCVNNSFRAETANDAISSLLATNYQMNNRMDGMNYRMVEMEHELWGDDEDAMEVTDTEE